MQRIAVRLLRTGKLCNGWRPVSEQIGYWRAKPGPAAPVVLLVLDLYFSQDARDTSMSFAPVRTTSNPKCAPCLVKRRVRLRTQSLRIHHSSNPIRIREKGCSHFAL